MAAQQYYVPNPTPQSASPRPRLLLMAYYCQPNRGSEFGAGWNRALESAKDCDTWVISRNGPTADRIREYFRTNGEIPGLKFAFVELPAWQETLLDLPWIKWVMARWWHRKALELARRLHDEHKFELVQHVTCISYREPGELWKLNIPFIWGPIGGADSVPWNFLLEGGPTAAINEGLRSLVNVLQMNWSPRISKVTKRADYILYSNSLIKERFERLHGVTGPVLQDTGIRNVIEAPREPRTDGGQLRLLWSGAFESRKALSLLLKALAQLPNEVDYRLRILGEGTMERRWKRQAEKLGVADRTEWLGWLPFDEAQSQYNWADVFVFTSLRDTGGNVNLEAMSNGLPVICLDHQGVHDIVCEACGVKIPVTNSRGVVRGIRDALVMLFENPELRCEMGRKAWERSKYYLWSHNRADMLGVYNTLMAKWQVRGEATAKVEGVANGAWHEIGMPPMSGQPLVGVGNGIAAESAAIAGVQSPS